MKTVVQINAIEATISIDESDGSYTLELKLEYANGTIGEITKKLSKPSFRLELHKQEEPDKQSN